MARQKIVMHKEWHFIKLKADTSTAKNPTERLEVENARKARIEGQLARLKQNGSISENTPCCIAIGENYYVKKEGRISKLQIMDDPEAKPKLAGLFQGEFESKIISSEDQAVLAKYTDDFQRFLPKKIAQTQQLGEHSWYIDGLSESLSEQIHKVSEKIKPGKAVEGKDKHAVKRDVLLAAKRTLEAAGRFPQNVPPLNAKQLQDKLKTLIEELQAIINDPKNAAYKKTSKDESETERLVGQVLRFLDKRLPSEEDVAKVVLREKYKQYNLKLMNVIGSTVTKEEIKEKSQGTNLIIKMVDLKNKETCSLYYFDVDKNTFKKIADRNQNFYLFRGLDTPMFSYAGSEKNVFFLGSDRIQEPEITVRKLDDFEMRLFDKCLIPPPWKTSQEAKVPEAERPKQVGNFFPAEKKPTLTDMQEILKKELESRIQGLRAQGERQPLKGKQADELSLLNAARTHLLNPSVATLANVTLLYESYARQTRSSVQPHTTRYLVQTIVENTPQPTGPELKT